MHDFVAIAQTYSNGLQEDLSMTFMPIALPPAAIYKQSIVMVDLFFVIERAELYPDEMRTRRIPDAN